MSLIAIIRLNASQLAYCASLIGEPHLEFFDRDIACRQIRAYQRTLARRAVGQGGEAPCPQQMENGGVERAPAMRADHRKSCVRLLKRLERLVQSKGYPRAERQRQFFIHPIAATQPELMRRARRQLHQLIISPRACRQFEQIVI